VNLVRLSLRQLLLRLALVLLVCGSGPLMAIMLDGTLKITGKINPDPVLLAILAILGFGPSLILVVAVARTRFRRSDAASGDLDKLGVDILVQVASLLVAVLALYGVSTVVRLFILLGGR
jgi:hypothetical protein